MKKPILLCIVILHINLANAQKLNTAIIHSMEAAIENGSFPNMHSILISRSNTLIYENYWAGKDEKNYDDLGVIPHGKDSLHDIRSVSKSIVSACIGIAIEQRKIQSIHQKLFDFFPEYANQDTGLKAGITIKDLLTMTSGLKWKEGDEVSDSENDENKMWHVPDPVGYILNRPMAFPPGKVWNYSGGATQLLASIIQKTTGKTIDQFASEYLFAPLGISTFEWIKYNGADLAAAAGGLRLKPRDLLKFGLLYLRQGKWGGKQIVPTRWVTESTKPYVKTDNSGTEYGFQFWVWTDTIMNRPVSLVVCIGHGGQRIFIDKEHRLVVVFTAGNYDNTDNQKKAYTLLADFIYPALFNKEK
jgi:CubicO group peptidase (beta-lactamase class C family)